MYPPNHIQIIVLSTLLMLCTPIMLLSQQTEHIPVRPTFESTYLINGQTVTMQSAKTLEFTIQHRFGKIGSDSFDLLGLYAPANDIRMGFNYYITDRVQLGIGSTKSNLLQDLNWKWLLLQQDRDDVIPVSVVYAGNLAITVRDDPAFYPEFSHRLSYYHKLMVARRFNERFSLQLSGSLGHFNTLDEGKEHDNVSVAARSRYGIILAQLFVLLEYEQPLTSHEALSPEPNVGVGLEFATKGHQFQLFVSNYSGLMPQRNMLYNTNDPANFDFLLGFNIIRRWNL